MGLFDIFLGQLKTPDYEGKTMNSDEAYETWLDTYSIHKLNFSQWKKKYSIKVIKTEEEKYFSKINKLNRQYTSQIMEIERLWKLMLSNKSFEGVNAIALENTCKQNIKLCVSIREVEKYYGEEQIKYTPAFKRLAMLYDKQGRFKDEILTCEHAISTGFNIEDATKRKERAIKKLNDFK